MSRMNYKLFLVTYFFDPKSQNFSFNVLVLVRTLKTTFNKFRSFPIKCMSTHVHSKRLVSHEKCEKELCSFEFVLVGQDHLIHILEIFLEFQEGVQAHRVVELQLPTQFLGQRSGLIFACSSALLAWV